MSKIVYIRRKRRTPVKRLILLAAVLAAFICLMTAVIGQRTVQATAPDAYKYYTHIVVKEGDSLWDIAGRYMGHEYEDRKAYIKEVCAINHMETTRIYAGNTLVVPYYDTVEK